MGKWKRKLWAAEFDPPTGETRRVIVFREERDRAEWMAASPTTRRVIAGSAVRRWRRSDPSQIDLIAPR
jgi:hypothetical protein